MANLCLISMSKYQLAKSECIALVENIFQTPRPHNNAIPKIRYHVISVNISFLPIKVFGLYFWQTMANHILAVFLSTVLLWVSISLPSLSASLYSQILDSCQKWRAVGVVHKRKRNCCSRVSSIRKTWRLTLGNLAPIATESRRFLRQQRSLVVFLGYTFLSNPGL